MTQLEYLVSMKPWTSQDIEQRLHEWARDEGTDERARLTRRILEVASEHFARFGFRRANVGDIARDVGIGKGTVYLHFDSKKTLLYACFAYEKLGLMPQVQRMMALPLEQQLESYLQLSLRFLLTSPLTRTLRSGDRELQAMMTDTSFDEERAQGNALFEHVLGPHTPNLDDEARAKLRETLQTALMVVVHASEDQWKSLRSVDEFVQTYTAVLLHGVGGLVPA